VEEGMLLDHIKNGLKPEEALKFILKGKRKRSESTKNKK
jgi:hypothetical protein